MRIVFKLQIQITFVKLKCKIH